MATKRKTAKRRAAAPKRKTAARTSKTKKAATKRRTSARPARGSAARPSRKQTARDTQTVVGQAFDTAVRKSRKAARSVKKSLTELFT